MQVEANAVQRDASARAQAASSLAKVACELYTPAQPASDSASADSASPHDESHVATVRENGTASGTVPAVSSTTQQRDFASSTAPASILLTAVIQPLLTAMHDYSTDNRCAQGFSGHMLLRVAPVAERLSLIRV